MRFLVDRCAGRRLAEWLEQQGHDVVESRSLGPDPGDQRLLEIALEQERALVTIDTDFGSLIFVSRNPHRGLVRLPDVPPRARIELMRQVLERHGRELAAGAVITVRGDKIRISLPGD
jgi:predicted nuclease of predicted toxin-antitoxin system